VKAPVAASVIVNAPIVAGVSTANVTVPNADQPGSHPEKAGVSSTSRRAPSVGVSVDGVAPV
jgi:hypothetical protein